MAKNYTADKAKATRLKRWSAVLLVFSAAQLAIQIAIFGKFNSYNDVSDQAALWMVCNGMVIASGAYDVLCSLLMLCCLSTSLSSNRETSSRCLIFFALTIALLSGVASVVVSALESHRINKSPNHPCWVGNSEIIQCGLWFDLEIGAAVAAALSTLVTLVLLLVASKKSKVQPASQESKKVEQIPEQQQEAAPGEVTVHVVASAATGPVTEEHVSSSPPEVEQHREQPDPVQRVSIVDEGSSRALELSEEMLSYTQQLRQMTRDELEREMARQFQIKFLKELRLEIDRRNLFSSEEHHQESASSPRASKPADQLRYRRSDASSVASSKRSSRPPPIDLRASSPLSRQAPPTPDYDLNDV